MTKFSAVVESVDVMHVDVVTFGANGSVQTVPEPVMAPVRVRAQIDGVPPFVFMAETEVHGASHDRDKHSTAKGDLPFAVGDKLTVTVEKAG